MYPLSIIMAKELRIESKDIQFIEDNKLSMPQKCYDLLDRVNVAELNTFDLGFYFKHKGIQAINSGDYFNAFKNWQESLKIAIENEYSELIDSGHLNLSAIYYYTDQHKKAIHHAFIAYRSNDKKFKTLASQNLALTYETTEDYEEAMHYNNIAIQLSEELNKPDSSLAALVNIGNILIKLGRTDEALSYFERAIDVTKQGELVTKHSDAFVYLARYYAEIKDFELAQKFGLKSLELAQQSGVKRNYPVIYNVLIESAYRLGNVEEAKKYADTFKTLDSYDGDHHSRDGIYDLLINIEEETQGAAAGLAAAKEKLDYLKVKNESNKKQFELFRQFKEDEQELIVASNRKLEFSNKELLDIAKILAHDIKTPVRTLGSFSELIKKELNGQVNPKVDEYLEFISNASAELYAKLESALELMIMDLKRPLVSVDLNIVVSKLSDRFSNLTVLQSKPLPIIESNEDLVLELFSQLMQNALEACSEENAIVTIGSSENSEFLHLTFTDNGAGISETEIHRVFDIFYSDKKVDHRGIGLAKVKKIIELHEGNIEIESEVDEGTRISIGLPLHLKV